LGHTSEILLMTDRIKLVRGDTKPQLRLTLTNETTGQPINLTGATVTLHFRAAGSDTVLFSRPALINPQYASSGIAYLDWEEGDLDQEGGNYEGEIEVVLTDGSRETIYDILKFKLREDFA
jgi:hypothetical protein